jgi:hypothetical protein
MGRAACVHQVFSGCPNRQCGCQDKTLVRYAELSGMMTWALEQSFSARWPCVATGQGHLYVLYTRLALPNACIAVASSC